MMQLTRGPLYLAYERVQSDIAMLHKERKIKPDEGRLKHQQ